MDNKNVKTIMSVEKIENKKNAYIKKYNAEVDKCNKSAWGLAKVVFETVNASDFADVFGKLGDYAKALNVSNSAISNLVKAYSAKAFIATNNAVLPNIDNTKLSVGQCVEIGAIDDSLKNDFIVKMEVTENDTVKAIREKVKKYNNPDAIEVTSEEITEDTETSETDEKEVSEVEVSADEIMTINYGNLKFEIDDICKIGMVLDVLGIDKVTE